MAYLDRSGGDLPTRESFRLKLVIVRTTSHRLSEECPYLFDDTQYGGT